jgi:acetate kinase
MSLDEIDVLLNKKSGLLGLSDTSNDVRELEERAAGGDEGASRALAVFTYRIRKYVGAYLAALGRTDAVVFTAGIGENSASVRRQVCEGLERLGISLDLGANEAPGHGARDVSRAGSATRVLVVPTDEELLIASDTYRLAAR